MARAKKPNMRIDAKASAKVEAVARATYQRKRTTTEIIPADVTRAKAGRWLDLISPITEWAGLRGDALRFQRDQLRIRQEAALEKLADTVRGMMQGQMVLHPLPPKILVPALEAVSLEDPMSPLIHWWAKLLVSGATQAPLRPFLIDLMSKLGPEEAHFLETIWNEFSKEETNDRLLKKEEGTLVVAGTLATVNVSRVARLYEEIVSDNLKKMNSDDKSSDGIRFMIEAEKDISSLGSEFGVGIEATSPFFLTSYWSNWTHISRNIAGSLISVDVCRALNLLERYEKSGSVQDSRGDARGYSIRILHFTGLGIEFMQATH